jgi:hypothetical protein
LNKLNNESLEAKNPKNNRNLAIRTAYSKAEINRTSFIMTSDDEESFQLTEHLDVLQSKENKNWNH